MHSGFLEHWTLVSAVVSSLPRWSIAIPPAVKPVPQEERVDRLYMTREGTTHAVKNNKAKNKPRNARLVESATLKRCRRGHMTSVFVFFSYSFVFPSLPLEAPSQQGVVSVETMDSRFSPQRNCYYGNLT